MDATKPSGIGNVILTDPSAGGKRPLCVPGSESAAGGAGSRHQRGCAGGGLSARPLCVPGSEGVAG
eukprot:3773464-Pyramimonas_sp.AAC.1